MSTEQVKGLTKSSELNLEQPSSWRRARRGKRICWGASVSHLVIRNHKRLKDVRRTYVLEAKKNTAANMPGACSLGGSLQSQPCSRHESSSITRKANRLNLHQGIS